VIWHGISVEVVSLNLNFIVYLSFSVKYSLCWVSHVDGEFEPTHESEC
jgi:hypothetical protein